MFARIENGQVAELMDVAKLPPLHPDLAAKFVEIAATAEEGDIYDTETGTLSKPQISEEERRQAIDEEISAQILKAYPMREQLDDIWTALGQVSGVVLPARATAMQSYINDTRVAGNAAAQAGKKANEIVWPAAPNV